MQGPRRIVQFLEHLLVVAGRVGGNFFSRSAGRARQVSGTADGRQNSPAHGASSVRIMGGIMGGEIRTYATKAFEMWWPGTELNRRRQPFQGCSRPSPFY